MDRRTQSVRLMSIRCSPELPHCILKAHTQAFEAFREAHRAPLPVRVRQHKVIEQVIEWLALDPYPEAIHVREVRLTKLAWLVPLLEKHFFRWTLERTPLLHPPLQRSKLPVLKLTRVTTLEILEQRLRLKAWVQLQLRANLLPHLFETNPHACASLVPCSFHSAASSNDGTFAPSSHPSRTSPPPTTAFAPGSTASSASSPDSLLSIQSPFFSDRPETGNSICRQAGILIVADHLLV